MKRKIISVSITLITPIISVIILFKLTENHNFKQGSFTRLYPPHATELSASIDMKYMGYYVAGSAGGNIYLGNSSAPLHVLVYNQASQDTSHLQINFAHHENAVSKACKVVIDSPNFYLVDRVRQQLFKGNINNFVAVKYPIDSVYFSDALPINENSFALKTLSKQTLENVLAKETMNPPHVLYTTNVLEKQIDGTFCTDGMFLYSKDLYQLVYIYLYRNEYISLDTNLNIIRKGRTIDPIETAQIKVSMISSESTYTMSAPPLIVNAKSTVSGNWLLVNSKIAANNEDKTLFSMSSIIDVYNLKEMQYKFSFRLIDRNERKMTHFKLINNSHLAVLHDHFLYLYDISPKYFNE